MKVVRQNDFMPITITLESSEEVDVLQRILIPTQKDVDLEDFAAELYRYIDELLAIEDDNE